MKIVINKCYGGFGLSPEALLRLHKLGAKVATPVAAYFAEDDGFLGSKKALKDWRVYLKDKKRNIFLHVFSPDEKFVLSCDLKRNDPLLVQVVEEIGDAANGPHADIKVIDIDDDVDWEIDEYDGLEHIAEKHRTWA